MGIRLLVLSKAECRGDPRLNQKGLFKLLWEGIEPGLVDNQEPMDVFYNLF